MHGSSEVREGDALREEIAQLRRRIADLEAERDEFAQQNAELFVLQQVFSAMNSTLDIDDILSTVLRGSPHGQPPLRYLRMNGGSESAPSNAADCACRRPAM